MSIDQKDTYFVAVKVFLEKDDQLLILKDNFGDWDLPGGRIKKDEFTTPLEQIVKRKMMEEVGDNVKYTITIPTIFMRHERQEAVPGSPIVHIFGLGYRGKLESGEIQLSPRHVEMKWVDIGTFKPGEYFTGGWLEGVREYIDTMRE